jgi:hypothetical protein
MKDTTYTITFKDADGNDLYSKTVVRTHIEEVEAMAYFILNAGRPDAKSCTIKAN